MESIANDTFRTVDTRYDESDAMDPGGIIGGASSGGVKPKRTRRVKDSGTGTGGVKAQGGESGGGIYLLIELGTDTVVFVDPNAEKQAAARVILEPDRYSLWKSTRVEPESVFQK